MDFMLNPNVKIERAGQGPSFLHVDEPLPPPRPVTSITIAAVIARPAIEPLRNHAWCSPAFLRGTNQVDKLFPSPYGIFPVEDEFDEGRSRKRTRFARSSGEWRYSPEFFSPPKEASATVPVATPLSANEDCLWEQLPASEPVTPNSARRWNVHISDVPVLDLTISPELPREGDKALHSLLPDNTNVKPTLLPQLQTNLVSSLPFAAPVLTPVLPSTPSSPRLQPVQSAGLLQLSPFAPINEAVFKESHDMEADQAAATPSASISTKSNNGDVATDHEQSYVPSSSSGFSTSDAEPPENPLAEEYHNFGFDGAAVSRAYSVERSEERVHVPAAANAVEVENIPPLKLDTLDVEHSSQDLELDQSSVEVLSDQALRQFHTIIDETPIEVSYTRLYEAKNDRQVLETQLSAEMDPLASNESLTDQDRQIVEVPETWTQNTSVNEIVIVDLSSDEEDDVDMVNDKRNTSLYDIPQEELLRGPPHEDQSRGSGKAFDESDDNDKFGITSPDADRSDHVETSIDEERRSVLYDIAHVNPSRQRTQRAGEKSEAHKLIETINVGHSNNGDHSDVEEDSVNAGEVGSSSEQEIVSANVAGSSEEQDIPVSVKQSNDTETHREFVQEDPLEVNLTSPRSLVDLAVQPLLSPSLPASEESENHASRSPSPLCQLNSGAPHSTIDASERLPTPEASQDLFAQSQDFVMINQRPDQILQSSLPLTPLPTQPELRAPELAQERAMAQPLISVDRVAPRRSSHRRQRRHPISNVPDIISPWFMSRRVAPVDDSEENSDNIEVTETASELSSLPELSPENIVQIERRFEARTSLASVASTQRHHREVEHSASPAAGLRTPLSYYTPLSTLETYLNASPSDQNAAIDVFAVVTSPTSKPSRAKAGPREHFTITHISDTSCFPKTIEVHVFRRWKNSLPVANVGDVILLRNFLVKSRKRQCHLLSGEASAWYVWKLSNYHENRENDNENKPIWAKQATNDVGAFIEECKGAPVELGSEERDHTRALRTWWDAINDSKCDLEVSPMPGRRLATV